MLPREADATVHLDRRRAHLVEVVAGERECHRGGAVTLRPGRRRRRPSTRSTRPRGRARPRAACRRTGAAPPGTSPIGAPNCWRSVAYSTDSSSARAAAPTPSTTLADAEPVHGRGDRVASRRRCRVGAPARPSVRPCASLRLPSTVGAAIVAPRRRRRRRRTRRARRRPSVAVTTKRSAADAVGHVHLLAVDVPRVAVGVAVVLGARHSARRPGSRSATVPTVSPDARPGRRSSRSTSEPARATRLDRADRRRREGSRVHGAAELLGTTATSTMPLPAPPWASGTSRPTTPSSARPDHTASVVPRGSSYISRT